jgi:hypothetical protein
VRRIAVRIEPAARAIPRAVFGDIRVDANVIAPGSLDTHAPRKITPTAREAPLTATTKETRRDNVWI